MLLRVASNSWHTIYYFSFFMRVHCSYIVHIALFSVSMIYHEDKVSNLIWVTVYFNTLHEPITVRLTGRARDGHLIIIITIFSHRNLNINYRRQREVSEKIINMTISIYIALSLRWPVYRFGYFFHFLFSLFETVLMETRILNLVLVFVSSKILNRS